jgi:phospholipid/cholesterol/gamma-HCH transport system substrate-binding protein
MRFRKKDKTNLIKVGIFVTALTAVLMVMIVSIGKESSLFEPKVKIRARVPNVSNLKAGSYVELKGIRIGSVSDIRIATEDVVELELTILESELKWIKADSRVSISTAGLVGDKYVEVYKGSREAANFDPSADVLTAEDSIELKQIMNKGDSIATVTERILLKLDAVLTRLDDGNQLVSTVASLNRTAENLESVSDELRKAKLGAMAKDVSAGMGNLSKASGTLDRVLSRIESGPGTANALIYDDAVHDDLRAVLGGAQRNKVIKYFIRESIKKSEEKRPRVD